MAVRYEVVIYMDSYNLRFLQYYTVLLVAIKLICDWICENVHSSHIQFFNFGAS